MVLELQFMEFTALNSLPTSSSTEALSTAGVVVTPSQEKAQNERAYPPSSGLLMSPVTPVPTLDVKPEVIGIAIATGVAGLAFGLTLQQGNIGSTLLFFGPLAAAAVALFSLKVLAR